MNDCIVRELQRPEGLVMIKVRALVTCMSDHDVSIGVGRASVSFAWCV
jgi:hypothetical protein